MGHMPHHSVSYSMPEVTHGRYNLNPPPMLAGVVDTSALRMADMPTISGLVTSPREHLKVDGINVVKCSDIPATKVPLGMVRLEQH